jgi:hypothetical protein
MSIARCETATARRDVGVEEIHVREETLSLIAGQPPLEVVSAVTRGTPCDEIAVHLSRRFRGRWRRDDPRGTAWVWLLLCGFGIATLGAYGLVVNLLALDFSKLLATYVAFFAIVSIAFGRLLW